MNVFAVSELVGHLRAILEANPVFADVWVRGEVSNLSVSQAGHQYFTIKDAQSALRCVLFRRQSYGAPPENGSSVVVHGRLSLYEARGDLQFYVDFVQPEGKGLLQMQFELLRAKLEEEGLFDPARKRPLPAFPRVIGVATSPTGAVFHDIVHVLQRRYPLVEVVLAPTQVQGDAAAANIVAALAALNASGDIDIIILARGGGSIEDLWPFNEEAVARAIYGSRIPVVSAVGHETDWTIADLVADVRAPTPSAAAEVVAPDRAELYGILAQRQQGLLAAVRRVLWEEQRIVETAAQRLRHLAPDIAARRHTVDELSRTMAGVVRQQQTLWRERIAGAERQLDALDARRTLARGYAIVVRRADHAVVTSTAQVQRGDRLAVRVSDGSFGAQVSRERSGQEVQGNLI